VKKKLEKIFIKHLKIKNVKSTKLGKGKWDSLCHLNIIMDIEDKFKIKINTKQIQNTKSFDQFVDLLNLKK